MDTHRVIALSTFASIRAMRGLFVLFLLLDPRAGCADDLLHRVTFTDDARHTREVSGKILLEAVDGGILLLGRDGRLWNVTPEQLKTREATGEKFQPLSSAELGAELRAELGAGFEIVTTKHYVICTNAGVKYAHWCGALFERLLASFQTHWKSPQLEMHGPEFPLPAIVLANQRQFAEFAAKDAGAAYAASQGYYAIRTNRMVLYDLTADASGRASASLEEINRKAAAAPANVATVVHEATHQIAFNSGLHVRFADNPLWLTEGMAMYFETPDLRSRSGWRTVGQPNPVRLRQFRDYAKRRPANSLTSLLESDARFRDAASVADVYAESWAVSYFLIKTRRAAYLEYLKRISAKPRLIADSSEDRLADFQAAFGDDLEKLERDFLRYMGK